MFPHRSNQSNLIKSLRSIARQIADQDVGVGWDNNPEYKACAYPKLKLILLHEKSTKLDCLIAIVHEVGHILHTTYNMAQVAEKQPEMDVFNGLEDLRIDRKMKKRIPVNQFLYNRLFSDEKFLKSLPLWFRSYIQALVELEGFTFPSTPAVIRCIKETHMKDLIEPGVATLEKLEHNPTSDNYATARNIVKELTGILINYEGGPNED